MKKFYLIILSLVIISAAIAQERDYNYVAPKYKTTNNKVQQQNSNSAKGVKAMLVDESFEIAVPPTGWTPLSPDGGSGWDRQTAGTTPLPGWTGGEVTVPDGGGNAIAYCTWSTGGSTSNDQWLITPQVSVSTGDNLSFYITNFYLNYADEVQVLLSTTTAEAASFTETLGTITWAGTGSGADVWTEYEYSLDAYDGQDVYIAFREVVADNYNDGGAIGLDLIRVGSPVALDLGVVDIDLPPIFGTGLMDISGTVQNFGSDNITDFDLVYTINGTDVSTTYSVSGIDIAYGETYYFTHDVQYDFATADTYTVEVEISNVNGVVDENVENDVLSIDVDAAEGVVQRKPLNEVFTSSTCGYCPDDNANIDAITLDPANIDACTLIKYQVSWPGDGDPYQTPMAADRVSFYGITGVPAFFVDANEDAGDTYTQTDLDTYAAVPAFFEIDGEHTIVGDQVDIDVTITPNVNFTGVCHVVVVEKETTGNATTNGETEFHNVMMAMLPTSAGTSVDLTAGVPYNFSVSKDMSDTFVEETYDCEVVMFLQNPGTQEVMQSNYSVLNNTGSDLILTDVEVVATITDCVYSDASEIQVTLYNYGVDDITEFDVQYTVDGGTPVSETVTYTIAAGDTYVYTFPTTADLSALGVHEVAAECSFAADVYTENNSGETSVLSGDDLITIDITFDDYPGETSWDLVDQATSTVIAEGSFYTGTSTTEEVCVLSSSCYTFTIYDAYGDGMCCDYGNGSYTVTRGGVEMASGGEFGASESSDISIPIDITLEDITICPGETITFPVAGIGSYDVDATSIDNNTPATTTVTYTIDEGGVCEVSESFDVIVLDDALDITPEDITVCQGETITFMSGVGTFDPASVSNTTVAVTTVTYTVNEGTSCENSATFDVTVLEAPEAVITEEADYTLTTTSTDDIQWYLDDVMIDGETGQTYVCTADGDYYAIMSNANCSTQSNTITITGTFAELFNAEGLNVFPNPTDSKLYVEFKEYSELTIKVLDYTGKVILERNINSGEYIDVSELSAGVYFVDVKNINNEGGMYKIVVE